MGSINGLECGFLPSSEFVEVLNPAREKPFQRALAFAAVRGASQISCFFPIRPSILVGHLPQPRLLFIQEGLTASRLPRETPTWRWADQWSRGWPKPDGFQRQLGQAVVPALAGASCRGANRDF